MADLAEFLLARIAEDEAAARAALAWQRADPADHWRDEGGTLYDGTDAQIAGYVGDDVGPHIARWDPARVLAECEAKRQIIDAAWADHLRIEGEWGHCRSREELSAKNDYPEVVLLLALPYASHPDYREEWNPAVTVRRP